MFFFNHIYIITVYQYIIHTERISLCNVKNDTFRWNAYLCVN